MLQLCFVKGDGKQIRGPKIKSLTHFIYCEDQKTIQGVSSWSLCRVDEFNPISYSNAC